MPKILIIDDEPHIRMLYSEEFQALGYETVTSNGNSPVLDLLATHSPDLVVLDIKLENDRSGLDVLQEIRSHNGELPVILCSAYDAFQHDFKSIAANHYVVKSVDSSELLQKVQQILKTTAKETEQPS